MVMLLMVIAVAACGSSDDQQADEANDGAGAGAEGTGPDADPSPAAAATIAPSSTTTTVATTTTTEPPPLPIRLLVAGDSYSSGEGLGDAEGRCARSPSAYGPLAARRLAADGVDVERVVLAACTGATVGNWSGQLDQWDGDAPNLIAVTMGGNDGGFVPLMADCLGVDDGLEVVGDADDLDLGAAVGLLVNRGCDTSEADVEADTDAVADRLRGLYTSMVEAVGENGEVYVLGYPVPLADPDGWSGPRCDGIARDDARFLRRAAAGLNEAIAEATEVDDRVHFVEVASTFEGHARCSPDPWLFGLEDLIGRDDGDRLTLALTRPFHPTEDGHEAMAELLAEAVLGNR